jgi:hypothetical protein
MSATVSGIVRAFLTVAVLGTMIAVTELAGPLRRGVGICAIIPFLSAFLLVCISAETA